MLNKTTAIMHSTKRIRPPRLMLGAGSIRSADTVKIMKSKMVMQKINKFCLPWSSLKISKCGETVSFVNIGIMINAR